jgi:hypothetical protein
MDECMDKLINEWVKDNKKMDKWIKIIEVLTDGWVNK